MKFILCGRYSPTTYVDAFMATSYKGFDFSFIELGCESALIAFDDGKELDRTYDMGALSNLVESVTAPARVPPSDVLARGYAQDPLPGLETPPCR